MNTSTLNYSTDLYTCAVEAFHVPIKFSQCFERYFILHWPPAYLISVFNNGTLIKDNIEYHVVNQVMETIIEWQTAGDKHIRISFRKLPDMKYGFALIRREKK